MSPQPRSGRPLYRQVADDLSAQIRSGKLRPGAKLPSERRLCEQYGVSQITVRRSLRELAHIELVYSRHGVGWFVTDRMLEPSSLPSEAGTTASSPSVTLLLPSLEGLLADIAESVAYGLAREGIVPHLILTDGDADREQTHLTRWQRRARQETMGSSVLVIAPCSQDRRGVEALDELRSHGDHVLALLTHSDGASLLPSVVLDQALCVSKVTHHLLNLGHRHLAYLGHSAKSGNLASAGGQHYWGFATSLWDEGLELPLDWVFASPLWDDTAHDRIGEQGARLRDVMSRSHRPTAIVCDSDLCAAEAMRLLNTMGLLCPHDVAIVGLGDRATSAFLSPPLTTLRFDLKSLGRAVLQACLDLLAGRLFESVSFSGEVIVRSSCGARR